MSIQPVRLPGDPWDESRTKQQYKDSCDINKIMAKGAVAKTLSFAEKYPAPTFGMFQNIDLVEAMYQVDRAREIFADAPAEIRREFQQDPLAFARYCSDPANVNRLTELLPALAVPGNQMPNPVRRADPGTTPAPDAAPAPDPAPTPESPAP